MVLICRIFQVAVGRIFPHEFPLFLSFRYGGRYFQGNVFRISFVNDIFQRNHQCFICKVRREAVITVCNRDKANLEKWENLFQIITCLQILSSKAGQIFYNNAVDPPLFHILHHFFKSGTLKFCSGESIIYIHLIEVQILVVIDEGQK